MCITAYTVIYRKNRFRYLLPSYRCSEQEKKELYLFGVFFARLIILYSFILGSHKPIYFAAVILQRFQPNFKPGFVVSFPVDFLEYKMYFCMTNCGCFHLVSSKKHLKKSLKIFFLCFCFGAEYAVKRRLVNCSLSISDFLKK